jgi:Tol biopolymer transport system component
VPSRAFSFFYSLDPLQGQGKEIIRTKLGQANDLQWSISRDGSQIAIKSREQLKGQVRLLDLQNDKARDLELPKDWSITSLSWAVDGKALFLAAWAGRGTLIARIDLNGKTYNLVERQNGFVGGPISSRDGRHLAYFQNVDDSNAWLLENF